MSAIIEIIPATDFNQAEPVTQFFKVSGLQTLQDDFCRKTGVASLMMYPNGIPITKPSRFSRLCQLIRKTPKGGVNCTNSDRIIGSSARHGATIQPCKSGGLWDSGARIHVGQTYVANWLIGQVMNEEQATKIDKMMNYAYEIGADIDDFSAAIAQVTVMDEDKFTALSDALFIFAKQLGRFAEQKTADNFTECKTELSNIIAKQSNISVLYEVWDKMIDDYQQGKLKN
ncbi:MAG: PocR ligand-binding domain-containing protein [Thiotrichaceae bacterium]|nr:PocR ligand-binding domain-containing protein [Thiotrichaceae bacterium]